MAEATELITLPTAENALATFSAEKGLDPIIEQIRVQLSGVAYDMSTVKGRKECASDAFKVAQAKQAIEKRGKELSAQYKKIPAMIDAERKRAFDVLDSFQKQIRQPLTDWETAEEARQQRHKANIEWFRLRADECRDLDAAELRSSIAELQARVVDESYEEFEAEGHRVKERAATCLTDALTAREKRDAEQAELARLRAAEAERERKDKEDRIAREAAQKAQREADAAAQAERNAAARREAEAAEAVKTAKLEAQLAEERRIAAEKQAELDRRNAEAREREAAAEAERREKAAAEQAAAAERQRIADEQAAAEAEAKRREADVEHQRSVNRAALAELVKGGVPEAAAKQAITLIANGLIPKIRITY
ncbi:hypothetical protein CEG14_05575 [Bordetella genomosp. 1]|uniref:Cell envelope biogenesis protein TolA n=1 Tax=Bordetella genomosp. 1 TaxID=1395607 RepID=A0A261SNP6_9BORD|nr:hypothetical protein [Bordetella genomosp. 1]OZI39006.1 hypothetical protein CEG14_05575 [Bordetella genomosp. 1]